MASTKLPSGGASPNPQPTETASGQSRRGRGRPPLESSLRRGDPVAVSLTPEERQRIERGAQQHGLTPASYLRAAALDVLDPSPQLVSDGERAVANLLAALTRIPPALAVADLSEGDRQALAWRDAIHDAAFDMLAIFNKLLAGRKGRP